MFPTTHWTLVLTSQTGEARRRGLEALFATYWRPLYFYVRRRGLSVTAAEHAVQGFFLHLLESDFPSQLDPARARFRSHLIKAFDQYLVNLPEREATPESGGPAQFLPLDAAVAERDLATAPETPAAAFEREWALALMERAVARLGKEYQQGRRKGRAETVLKFFRLDAAPSFEEAAAESGITVPQLQASLHGARERFRAILREEVAQTVAKDREVDEELQDLLNALSARSEACLRCGTRYPIERLGICPRCMLEAEIPKATLGDSLELLEEIGRGGMSTVYKARHLRLDRFVAVKFLAEPLAEDPDFARRFEREARALALLNHPRIVGIHDFGREGNRGYIVMEYVEGRALSESLPLPPERACAIAIEICEALAYAHRQGVLHRDIKPQNILLDASGHVKITDFGVARLLGAESGWTVTATGSVLGTPHYMAPEARSGAPPDPRMDIYSLGIVLYEMIAARRPEGDFEPLPDPLDRIVRKACAPEPARRYLGVEEMAADLARASAIGESGTLAPDERNWLRAVALLQTLATAASLWAFLLSVTPRVMSPGEVQPLIMLGTEVLADGRIVSRARFETWPTLVALAAVAVAMAAHALLRRHWRHARLDRPRPDRAVPESGRVLACGLVAVVVYGLRKALERRGFGWAFSYVPILGGLIEICAVFFAWIALLEAWRTHRSFLREVRLWGGLALALVPPVSDLTLYLLAWRP